MGSGYIVQRALYWQPTGRTYAARLAHNELPERQLFELKRWRDQVPWSRSDPGQTGCARKDAEGQGRAKLWAARMGHAVTAKRTCASL
jgi:hypothetical protein